MSIIQLDMFSPLYYSTLGYDEELIDYLSQQIRKLFPQPLHEVTRGRVTRGRGC
jgi:hypothetical protein